MKEQEIFREKAKDGYMVCYAEQCPIKGQCLRWKVGQEMPETTLFFHCVNPRYQDVATEHCPQFRNAEKVRMAKGMTHIFNDDMPGRVEKYVRKMLINRYCRTYYYEYRNGSRLMPPDFQEEVRRLFREAGWDKAVDFDGYVEDYEW